VITADALLLYEIVREVRVRFNGDRRNKKVWKTMKDISRIQQYPDFIMLLNFRIKKRIAKTVKKRGLILVFEYT